MGKMVISVDVSEDEVLNEIERLEELSRHLDRSIQRLKNSVVIHAEKEPADKA